MNELVRFINKEKHKKYLEIFMILDEISKNNNILSFNYDNKYLMVEIAPNDFYRIKL